MCIRDRGDARAGAQAPSFLSTLRTTLSMQERPLGTRRWGAPRRPSAWRPLPLRALTMGGMCSG
eukprot:3685610-Alexandrium_andersonii.AAC.1